MKPYDYILKQIPKEGSILDLGCVSDNKGYLKKEHLFKYINKINPNTIGVDLNYEGGGHLESEGYKISYQDVQNFEFTKKFDVIVASNIIEHLTDLNEFIISMKKHLKKNGKILIMTPNAYSFINFLAILIKGKRKINPGHTMWQSLETLKILFKMYNLKIKKYEFVSEIANDSLINKLSTIIMKLFSIMRPAFASSILVEVTNEN